jgi:serine/threonine protein kinase
MADDRSAGADGVNPSGEPHHLPAGRLGSSEPFDPQETAADIDIQMERPSGDALVELLFHEASAIPRERRELWLESRCPDRAVRDEVASLLASADEAAAFLEQPPGEAVEFARAAAVEGRRAIESDCDPSERDSHRQRSRTAAEALLGRQIGEFTLQAVIGEGGMGVVYRAEQRQPQRVVALKLVRPGFTNPNMLRRLEIEAEVLGRLRHPGIASVYAAGTADVGCGQQPFVAMEFVEGWPLREWLAAAKPDMSTKVRVMIAIAEAVQHAHQNGIIHRDLKPENLLVEEQSGGAPRPRVLDFGVARLSRDIGVGQAQATEEGNLVGTLQYMSPEQVRGEPIDTRCDVYALGLILWEMFAGRPARKIEGGSLAGAVAAIISHSPSALHSIAPDVPLDLSLVTAKALEADIDRRYSGASEFAADLGRFLGNQPVTARAPTTAYLLRSYARRHPAQIAAALLVSLVTIVAFLAVTAAFLRTRAAESSERQRADESMAVADYILRTLRVDAQVQGDGQVDVVRLRELLDALERDVQSLDHRPQAQARILNALGERYHTLSDFPRAKSIFERSLTICDAALDRRNALRGAALHGLAAAEYFLAQGDREKLGRSRSLYEEALETRVAALGREHSDTALTMRHLAAALRAIGESARAERLYRDSLAIHERLHAMGDPLATTVMVASGYNGLASFLGGKGDHREAAVLLRRSLELMRSMPQSERRVVDEARILRNLGAEEGINGRFTEGLEALVESEGIFRQQLGQTNREVTTTILRRGQLELRRGQRAAAAACAEVVLNKSELAESDGLRTEAARLLESATAVPATDNPAAD